MKFHHALRATVSVAAFLTVAAAMPVQAQESSTIAAADDNAGGSDTDTAGNIVVTAKTTRSATALSSEEIQKILPGVSPLKAIQTLPGVLYITADPWGNNEQNAQIFIHGFNFQQLGYTMDGVPLGDQSYGNYNGLSPQRAVISENVGRVVVTTGAGDLGTASTSNLGGTVETFSADPAKALGGTINQTVGSYGTSRTYLRLDSGAFGPGGENSAYVSGVRQRARAWDFNGIQGGWQANAKFVHDNAAGKLTVFFDYSDKTEPNEDATSFFKPSPGKTASPAQLYTPGTRPFYYPDLAGMRAYMDAFGNTPSTQGGNYRNYYSDAQRTDYLTYARYDAKLGDRITWSNTGYYHHNDGVGVVAGPLGQSITVIQAYLDPNYATGPKYGTNANASAALVAATGGSGLVTRTTEYRIDREGGISNLDLDLGAHQIQLGAWFEHNSATQWRRWYGFDVNNPNASTPYIRPSNPLFTQYQGEARVNVLQLHVQDAWKVNEKLRVEAGVKTSAQWANGWFPVQPKAGSLSGLTGNLPSGRINTKNWFLPSVGATYDLNGHEQLYFNVQKNLHQYMAYLGGGSLSPWFTGSQSAFNSFAQQGKPETSWTYEAGARTHRSFDGILSGLDAQVNYYHVTFSNRLLAISTNPGGIAGGAIAGGTSILVNVGSVHTDGVDAAFTLHFGRMLSLYNATSYNSSTYQSDYSSTATGIGAAVPGCVGGGVVAGGVVPTCGKQVPGSPKWMNKSVATLSLGAFEAQVTGDYVGRRYATYANDTSVKSYFLTSLRVAAKLPSELVRLKKAELSLNVTNLADVGGWSTISVGSATNSYSVYPIAPRQFFVTLSAGF
ncbi:TonB-dependent receptor [Sphingomonas sp. TDK1]|uniref:TonB-dependent receptor n=1 Tax=Sphingomonas sp. TDK1 TaxID=453247 RepID=UPI0007D91BE7|nr:TonB-dependent receptor [Sphingomonas sp. TDK1]OAN66105.1 TonB-dependent receptor [Sphingomonas sp. TDK1]